jgi:ribonuclease HI
MDRVILCIASSGVPGGRCAWAAELQTERKRRRITGGSVESTPHRQLYRALLAGLEALRKPCRVTVYTNAEWLVSGMGSADAGTHGDIKREVHAAAAEHIVDFEWINAFPGSQTLRRLARDTATTGTLGGPDLAGPYTSEDIKQMGLF